MDELDMREDDGVPLGPAAGNGRKDDHEGCCPEVLDGSLRP